MPYLIAYLKKANIVDMPDERKIHTEAIPRMGGIIIYAIVLSITFSFTEDVNLVRPIVISSFFLVVCGIWDDIIGMKWSFKFILQVISAIILIVFLYPQIKQLSIFGIIIPFPFNFILLLFFIVGTINSINLMDGLDGLVTGFSIQVMWILLILSLISGNGILMLMIVTLLGSLFGFLKYNAYPAKVFLGDTGSLTLGFFIVLISILVTLKHLGNNLDLTFPIILLGIPIVDTIKVMSLRIIKKGNPFLADKTHLHHTIIHGRVRHKVTVVIILILSLLFGIDSIAYLKFPHEIAIIIFIFLSLCLIYVPAMMNRLTRMNVFLNTRPRLMHFSEVLRSMFISSFIPISLIITIVFLFISLPGRSKLPQEMLYLFLACVALMFLISFNRRLVNKSVRDIYVLLNFMVFFICSDFSSSVFKSFGVYHNTAQLTGDVFLTFITFMVLFFIYERDMLSSTYKTYLTGLDIILLVVVMSLYVMGLLFATRKLSFFGLNLVEAFVLFLWYKVVLYFNEKVSNYIFYSSFALPLLAIILIFLNT
jgi:UDP-GlcNAc:undecaprenyl-phosphate GlcNAc-1-phosphate transferase